MKKALSFAIIFLLATGIALAQTSKGILVGVARDSTGAVIVGAQVVVRNELTGESRNATTNATGAYRIDALGPGLYTLHATASGFDAVNVEHLKVDPSIVTSYEATLAVGSSATTVDVQATSNLIDTENAQLAGTFGTTELKNIPIFSLNPIELTYTAPGVQLTDQGGQGDGVSIQVNGSRPRANNFLIDGQDINEPTIAGQALQPQLPDIFQSVTVITNSASAEYGGAGGGIVNLITQGGTNHFHGGVWDLYSGSGLNALDGIQRQGPHTHGAKPRSNEHQYGFTIGGPIIKNKLFAFGSSQWSRIYGNETAAVNLLPNADGIAVLQGLVSQYPNAGILLSLLDNGSYLNSSTLIVAPGGGPATTVALGNGRPSVALDNFQRQPAAQKAPDTQWFYRVDWLPTSSDTFYFRYLHDRSSLSPDFFTNNTALPGFDTIQGGTSEQGGGGWTHVFTSHMVNELRASELRTNFGFLLAPGTTANPLSQLPQLNFAGESQAGFPGLGIAPGYPQDSAQDVYQIQDTLSYTKGRQTIRVGFDIGREIAVSGVPFNFNGALTFNKGGGFSDLGNFIDNYLGPSGQATIDLGKSRVDPHAYNQAYFIQDDIKLTPELTVNLGARYEYKANPENSVSFPAMDPNNPFLPITTKIKVKEDKNNIAPRIGLAFTPQGGGWLGAGKMAYHAGFGIFYDPLFLNIVDNSQTSAPNIAAPIATSTEGRGVANATSIIPTLSPVIDPTNQLELVVNNLVNPQTFQWNLGFERQLPANLKLTINYVGTRSEKLFANQQYNYFGPTQANGYDPSQRLDPTRGPIIARGNFADSIYHGVSTSVSHDFKHGLLVNGTYTFSKSLDDGSEVFTTFNQPTSYAANLAPGGRSGEWGASPYDHRHYFSVQYVYTIPGYNREKVLSLITNDWTISGDTTLQSGPPSTWSLSGIDTNGDGSSANDRPTLSNAHAPYSAVGIDGAFLGPDAVTGNLPVAGAYYDLATNNTSGTLVPVNASAVHFLIPTASGNVRRDSFRMPGVQYWNLALQKNIPLHALTHLEGNVLQLRAEAQDVGNHNNVEPFDIDLLDVGTSNFMNPSLNRSSASNGNLAQGRIIRLWAKFTF